MIFDYKKYLYYGLVGVISMLVLVFVPMIGSEAGIGFKFPTTASGWFIYIITKVLISVLNVLIFYCFMEQAKLNSKDNENYKKANEILLEFKQKDYKPLSPTAWTKKQWTSKGVTLFMGTAISTVGLTNAILKYDYMSLLTYLIVLIMGIIFGIMQMKSAEIYWTKEYYEYAKMVKIESENAIQEEKEKQITKGDIEKCLNTMEKNLERR